MKTSNKRIVAHEWSHRYQIMQCFSDEGNQHEKTPAGLTWAKHNLYTVRDGGFAIGEGFPEFMEDAVWQDGLVVRKSRTENFYGTKGYPYYKGEDEENTDGRKVEGSVMQYFWDLGDDTLTDDGDSPPMDIDDEGLYGKYENMGNVLKKIGAEVSAYKDYYGLMTAYIWRGVIDVEVFKEKWEEEYPMPDPLPGPDEITNEDYYIRELYDAVFYGTKPPSPSNLVAWPGPSKNQVVLNWNDNAFNEGLYFVYRRPLSDSGRPFNRNDIVEILPRGNEEDYLDQPGNGAWIYAVRTLTCDSSNFSNEVIARVMGDPQFRGGGQDYSDGRSQVPRSYTLHQNSPNPFNKSTCIKFQLPVETEISLVVYDVQDRLVRTLLNEIKNPGYYFVDWDGRDKRNHELSEGIYFCWLEAGRFRASKKTLLLR